MRFLLYIGSVGRIEKKKKPYIKNHRKSRNRRPGTQASLLWSLETARQEPKINMAEKLVDVIVNNIKTTWEKDQPPKLLCDMQASLTFQQLLLLSSFFRLKELFHVNNGLTTSSLFFGKCQKSGSVGRR